MRFNRNLYFLLAFSVMGISVAFASSNDTQQPITIEADRAELDEKKEISIYMGNVILQQGGIKIKADKLNVQAKEGQLLNITAEGNPIEFSQVRENLDDIRGSSLRMEYDAETKRFILLNNAELWQGENRFSGEHIQFDPEKEKVIATGGSGESDKSTQRVQITIQPKSQNNNTRNKP